MKTEDGSLAAAIEALRQEVARLAGRIQALEGSGTPRAVTAPVPAAPAAPAPARPAPAPAGPPEVFSEELILILGAAVAAYLGKKAPIRQIRLMGTTAWAQQGRVTIQASHNLE